MQKYGLAIADAMENKVPKTLYADGCSSGVMKLKSVHLEGMKTMKSNWIALALLGTLSGQAAANESMRDVEVVQVGSYQANTDHFVWFTATTQECRAASPGNPVMHFNEAQPGGKALLAVLMTALVNKRKVDVQTSGCSIFEVYLK